MAALDSPETASVGHEEPKEGAFDDAEQEALELNGLDRAVDILTGGDVQHADRHKEAARDADQVGKHAEKGHHQDQSDHPWQDQELDGRQAKGFQRSEEHTSE